MWKLGSKVKKGKADAKFKVKKNNPYEGWQYERKLGEGGYGAVHLYKNQGEFVAIKEFQNDEDGEEEFEFELTGFKKAFANGGGHENVVGFVAAFQVLEGCRIVLEYFEGGSLDQIWNLLPNYTESDVRDITMQVAAGLSYMRENKVVHRDIKPANVLVRSYDPIKVAVADLNFAKAANNANHMTVFLTNLGTSSYKAPEVNDKELRKQGKKRTYNHKCDIWSLGVMTYELLAGRYKPFQPTLDALESLKAEHENDDDMLMYEIEQLQDLTIKKAELIFTPRDRWQPISPEAMELVRRMLTRDYNDRIDYPEILEHAWNRSASLSTHSLYDSANYGNFQTGFERILSGA